MNIIYIITIYACARGEKNPPSYGEPRAGQVTVINDGQKGGVPSQYTANNFLRVMQYPFGIFLYRKSRSSAGHP